MPNGTYGGVGGRKTKVGQKTFVSRPTRFFKNAFDVLETKTSHNMRLFADQFGYSALI